MSLNIDKTIKPLMLLILLKTSMLDAQIIEFHLTKKNYPYFKTLQKKLTEEYNIPDSSFKIKKVDRCGKPNEEKLKKSILVACIKDNEEVEIYTHKKMQLINIVESYNE